MYRGFNRFDEVAKAYNDIKPIRGGRASPELATLTCTGATGWNRVRKINENEYLLLDGNWGWYSDSIRGNT